MPPRLNKRQQRELEELEALGGPKINDGSEDEIEEPGSSRNMPTFSNFLAPEEDEPESGGETLPAKSKSSKPKKKKKKSVSDLDGTRPEITTAKAPKPTVAPLPRNEKKALKKARAKVKKAANEELDKALAELSVQYPASQKLSQSTSNGPSLSELLSVSLQHLDSDAEMRKFFGSRVVQATRAAGPSTPGSRKQGSALKSNLTRPQPTWWAAKQREGLSIRALTEDELSEKLKRHSWSSMEEKWWTVEYSKKYKSMTKSFMQTVLSGDPQGFWDLLGKLPWHADTLLQVSEVFRHREEYAQAVDFVDRALFTYERSFIGAFTFTSGLNRLDFDHVENRPFFLAIHRQITDLQRRGCVRTAFEFARLMYTLDPWSDPHGALFHLDQLAIKAGMAQWLIDVYDNFSSRRTQKEHEQDNRVDPSILPGWAYARALAIRTMEKGEDHDKSTSALKEAVRDFPSIVPLLADKLEVTLPTEIRSHRDFKIETDASYLQDAPAVLHLLSHLYVQRSHPLWKDHASWFSQTVTETFVKLPSSLPITPRREEFLALYTSEPVRHSAYRHIMVLETSYRRLFSFFPRHILEAKSLSCDPLPPPTSVTEYDQEFFQGIDGMFSIRARTRSERAVDERRLAQLIPDAAFREQLQAFFQANPNFAERFPGGILQFAQVAGQLPPDVLEDMMLAEAMADNREMPGQMPGFEGLMIEEEQDVALAPTGNANPDPDDDELSNEDDDDDDEEDEEEISPLPRMLRNILGRLWGRNAAEENSSDEDDTVDNMGVD